MNFLAYRGVVLGFLIGLGIALLMSLMLSYTGRDEFAYITWAMLAGTPIAVGAITVFCSTDEQVKSWKYNAFQPWLSVFGWLLVALIFAWETVICIVMLLPLYLPLASLGGYVAAYIRHKKYGKSGGSAFAFVLLPMLIMPIESNFQTPTIFHDEVDKIIINAPIEMVWNSLPNIENIRANELNWTFSHFIGLPKPKSSRIDELKVGAVRKSTWEKGIYFHERITKIVPNRLLAYDVVVDEQAMKIANLDTHITIGDRYFDIEKGHYALVDLGDRTELRISTTYRMTTNVNWYGQLWANFVMDDFHHSVLNLIKNRNERLVATKF